jgi:hypothetical protein
LTTDGKAGIKRNVLLKGNPSKENAILTLKFKGFLYQFIQVYYGFAWGTNP